jgi:hypothetical protein
MAAVPTGSRIGKHHANNPASDVNTGPRDRSITRRSKSSLSVPSFDSPAKFAIAASLKVLMPISESA